MSLPLKGVVLSVALTAAVSSSCSRIAAPGDSYADGFAALKNKDFATAVHFFTQAIAKNQNNAYALWGRGFAYHHLSEFDNAIGDYNEAIRLEPTNVSVLINRGLTWLAKGEYEKAIADYDEGIRLDSNSSEALNSRAWIRATCTEEKFRDGAKAIDDATQACELTDWKSPEFLDTLAAAHAEAGQFDKAIKWQKRAIDQAPESEKADFGSRLELYQAGRPYRDEPGRTEPARRESHCLKKP